MALSSTPACQPTVTCLRENVSGKKVAGLRNNDTAKPLAEFLQTGMYGSTPPVAYAASRLSVGLFQLCVEHPVSHEFIKNNQTSTDFDSIKPCFPLYFVFLLYTR